MSKAVEYFLHDLTLNNRNKKTIYETAKFVLLSDLKTYYGVAQELGMPEGTIRTHIVIACKKLGLMGGGMTALRIGYTRFLEEELKMYEEVNG